ADWLPRLEIVFLGLGLLLSLYAGYRVALAQSPRRPRVLGALLPWALLMALLYLAGGWIVLQPMPMRGTLAGGQGDKIGETMTRGCLLCVFLLSSCHLITVSPGHARADGGTVRLSQRAGGYQVTVFTEPTPLRAGPVDVSVLVQDAATGQALPGAQVTVRA